MIKQDGNSSTDNRSSPRFLPVLLLLFIGSGCAALIYEIVWFQMLELVIGSSGVSMGVLLGTFMGGMCIGSIVLPRVISPAHHPLRIYAFLEIGIGVIGLLQLIAIPLFGHLYSESIGYGLPGIALRAVMCSAVLLPPTILMGATLPAIARWVRSDPKGVSWLGFFYGGNIFGAVIGSLLAGFYLLRVFDIATATYVAAGINALVAVASFGLTRSTSSGLQKSEERYDHPERAPGSRWIYAAIGISGLCALGSEVIWTRLLSLLIGSTVYTFSIVLAVFLMGLGIGSNIGSFLSRGIASSRTAFGLCQLLLVLGVAWGAYALSRSIPYWPVSPDLVTSPWISFQLDVARCMWAMLPAAILWGASFPLALASIATGNQDPGKLVGGVYAANTVGAILGAVLFSMLIIPQAGTQNAHRYLVILSSLAAGLILLPTVWERIKSLPGKKSLSIVRQRAKGLMLFGVSASVTVLLVWSIPKVPPELIAYGRHMLNWSAGAEYLYVGEGMNASIAVSETGNGVRNFHVSGKVEASTEPQDMRLQRMLGHIGGLYHDNPKSVLIIGFGAGVTAGSFVLYPDMENIVICEIEPLIPKIVSQYFAYENYDVFYNPLVKIIYDDARHYIYTTKEKFDIITSDPIHPWVKGAATLYTKEYFEQVKERLNPGGLVTQWVPLYESSPDVVKSELATFFEVFPNGTIWSNDVNGSGYDLVLVGRLEDTPIDVDKIQGKLNHPDYFYVSQSLGEVGIFSLFDLLSTYAGNRSDLEPWLQDAQINRDKNLRLQYLAGMGLNSYQGNYIYDEILKYRKFPDDLIIANEQFKQALREMLK